MNTSINELVDQIQTATDYQKNKQALKEKVLTDLHLAVGGGLFLITVELLAFLATWPNPTVYLTDVYDNPIKLDREEFLTQAQAHYQTVMNNWHIQHDDLKRIRKI
jgi:hypothetical protein